MVGEPHIAVPNGNGPCALGLYFLYGICGFTLLCVYIYKVTELAVQRMTKESWRQTLCPATLTFSYSYIWPVEARLSCKHRKCEVRV